jgi:NAD(P)-dependent dehydrogenase (short-subunit alcohol dehydrogenase family)
LIIGAIDTLSVTVAEALHQAGAATSFAFEAEEGELAIRLISQHQLRPERMRAVNLSAPQMLPMQLNSFEPLDIAVIVPRWFALGPFLEAADERWQNALTVNVEESVLILQAVAQLLIRQGKGGRMIVLGNISSLMPMPDTTVVGTSLAYLQDFSEQAALELAPHGITVNVVAPGWIEASWLDRQLSLERKQLLSTRIPLTGFGQAKDVGDACCFLASKLARYITGLTLPVDGGYLLAQRLQTALPG